MPSLFLLLQYDKVSPLHKAASGGHDGVAELLLKAGAQVDIRNRYESTPLHQAALGGHVGVAELLLKAGAQVDSRGHNGKTPEDIAASEDVPPRYSPERKDRVLEGRKRILGLLAVKLVVRRKVGPEGGELQTKPCTVTVPRGAVTMETEITCQVINPNDVTLPLKDGVMLVSDIIELGPHGTTFLQPVTVQMQYSSMSSGGAREAFVWVTEDGSQWTELKTTERNEGTLAVSVEHFSIFAVISQTKEDTFTVLTEGFKQTSSTQPAVQISFPGQAVNTDTQLTMQVQEVPKTAVENLKAKDQSSRGLVSTSPIVNVETVSDSEVQFHKPVTVRVPHPQHYMGVYHEGPTKLKVMSCEKGTEDWIDVTASITNMQITEEFVEFEVSHFTRYVVLVVEDIYRGAEELGPIALHLCRWLQHRDVQFILMQRDDNVKEVIIECKPAEEAEAEHTKLKQKGYKGPLPSDSVIIFEGQKVEVRLLDNVSIASSCTQPHITFHSQRRNRLQIQVKGQADSDGNGTVAFFALPRINVQKGKDKNSKLRNVRKKLEKLGHPSSGDLLPEKLCELPIHVPCDTAKETSEGAVGGATLKGVGKHFYYIKNHVSTDWEDLAFHLGFPDFDIKNIAGRNRDDKSRCMDMLNEWQKREGDAATIEVLKEALLGANLQSVVEGLDEHLEQMGRVGGVPAGK
ncbi:ankyrin-1-like [Branchiostoma lanceolatum]|uniref:ankyrin-1-like n=1 Tax=Branchiostoma lanceolatum TaxID=7740 RepID=UPI0034537E7D